MGSPAGKAAGLAVSLIPRAHGGASIGEAPRQSRWSRTPIAAALAMNWPNPAYVPQACAGARRLLEEADALLMTHTTVTATMAAAESCRRVDSLGQGRWDSLRPVSHLDERRRRCPAWHRRPESVALRQGGGVGNPVGRRNLLSGLVVAGGVIIGSFARGGDSIAAHGGGLDGYSCYNDRNAATITAIVAPARGRASPRNLKCSALSATKPVAHLNRWDRTSWATNEGVLKKWSGWGVLGLVGLLTFTSGNRDSSSRPYNEDAAGVLLRRR